MMATDEQLRLEVRELTDLLRTSATFGHLRDALAARGLSPSNTILAGFMEGEDESRYGVLLSAGGECIVFESEGDGTLTRWERIEDTSVLADDFEAVEVGIAMQRSGEIA